MSRLPILFGMLTGLLLAFGILAVEQRRTGPAERAPRPSLSDCEGRIDTLVVHYLEEAASVLTPIYRQLLAELPSDVTVHVVCPTRADFDHLRLGLGPTACQMTPVVTQHEMTPWSRESGVTLLRPRGEAGAEIWRARAGDQRVADDLARQLKRVTAQRSRLYFDGGDFVVDNHAVFVTPDVVKRNLQRTVSNRAELIEVLQRELGHRRIILLDEAPPHHAGMFMMPIGNRRMLVGDPGLGRQLLDGAQPPAGLRTMGIDFSATTQALFDSVASQCKAEGYHVVRVPVLPGKDGRTYVTPLNVVLDQRNGKRTVYMPIFREAEPLNTRAADIWRRMGFQVKPIDCSTAYIHYGSLRCLVSVMDRTER